MSDNNEPNFSTPPEEFEIIELDTNPLLTDEQKSWPVVDLIQEEEFAIEEVSASPALLLTVHLAEANGSPEAVTLSAAIAAASDCEVGLGGTGLDERQRCTQDGLTTLTLVPRTLDGARERLARVARIAAAFAGTKSACVM